MGVLQDHLVIGPGIQDRLNAYLFCCAAGGAPDLV